MAVVTKNRIKEILDDKKMSAYRLAKQIGRRTNTITRVINGERKASDRLKSDICEGLDKPASEVFYLDETPENSSQKDC